MSEYTHITSTTTRQPVLVVASEKVSANTFVEAAFGGKVRFAKRRSSGTLRSWPLLAPGSSERKSAESMAAAVGKGVAVAALAKEANVSVATLRRTLTALSFTLEVEGLKGQARAEWVKAANSNMAVAAAEQPAKEEKATPAPKEQPAKEQPKAKASKAKAKPASAPKVPNVATMRKRLAESGVEGVEALTVKQVKEQFLAL